jgi:chromosome segregation ATPase
MQALDEGRQRALLEQRMTDRTLAQDKERLELRSHVLTLRESEMEAHVQDRDRTIAELTGRVDMLTRMLQKEQATRDSVSRRLSAVEAELSAARQVIVPTPKRNPEFRHRKTAVKVAHRIKRSAARRKPAPMAKTHKQT